MTRSAGRAGLDVQDTTRTLSLWEKWSPEVQLQIFAYFAVCFIALSTIPNSIYDPGGREIVYVIGILGIWRYLWWFNHWMRALIFRHVTYPKMRARAAALWGSGWRPTPHPHPDDDLPRAPRDQRSRHPRARPRGARSRRPRHALARLQRARRRAEDRPPPQARRRATSTSRCKIIRQNQPGKRVAIALILRAMSRAGLGRQRHRRLHGRRLRPASRRDPQMLPAVRPRSRLARADHRRVRPRARARAGCSPGSTCALRSAGWPCRAMRCPTAF